MRSLLERLVCGAFATGAFALMFGLLATTATAQGDSDFDIELPIDREVSFSAWIPDGDPEAEDRDPISEEAALDEGSAGQGTAKRNATRKVASSESGTVVSMAPTIETHKGALSTKKKKKGRKCVTPSGQISETSTNSYDVEKVLIDSYVDDLTKASTLAWTTWHTDAEGEVDGFTVKRIRCGSPLHEAGFRNGDVVHEVNGREIDSIPAAMRAYRRLKRKDTLKVDLTRKDGSARQLRYELI